MRLLLLIALPMLLVAAAPAGAQDAPLSLRYELNAKQVAQGDSFQLDVVLTVRSQAPVEELSLPDLPRSFTVLQERRASSTQVGTVNGRRSITVEQRYMYLLRADEPGTFKIPEASARLGKSMAHAAPVVVKVVASDGAAAPDAEDPAPASGPMPGARFGKSLPATFLEVTVDRTSAWVGQQITATTEVYTQQPLAQWPRLPSLKPPGFFCTSLLSDDRPAPSQRSLGGRSYYVYLVNKDALFPLGAGDKTIPMQSVDLVPAGSFFSRTREIQARSATVNVTVKALPSENQPAKFPAGNVGHWQLHSSVRPTSGVLGQPLTLSLVATGTGSLEQLELPTWEGGADARVFPATQHREPRTTSAQDAELGGRVVVELLVQPQKEGPLRIPAFTLTTFNPDTGSYQQSSTQPIVVQVAAARAGGSAAAAHSGGARQVIAKGARPLKRGVGAQERPGDGLVLAAGALLALAFATGGVTALRRRRTTSSEGQRASLRRDRQKALDEARTRGDLAGVERVLMDALAETFGAAVRGVSTTELSRLLEAQLEARGRDRALAVDVVAFIRDVEAARYTKAGGGSGERDKLAAQAADLIARVEARP